jgi:hypothetical protein
MLFPNIPIRVEQLATAENTKSSDRIRPKNVKKNRKDTDTFARQLEPIQDEKYQHRLSISGQYPNEYGKDYVLF